MTSFVWLLLFLYGSNYVGAQTEVKPFQAMSCSFEVADVEYSEITAVSNVLKVCNRGKRPLSFKFKVTVPGGWKSLTNIEKIWTLGENDSIFLPVRLIGSSLRARGGVRYSISAILSVIETGQMLTASFMAGKPRLSNMKMEIHPGSRIYYPNDKVFMPFSVELINDGNERQDIVLSLFKRGEDVILTDSLGKFLKKNYREVSLKPYSDSLLPFGLTLLTEVRNRKRLDCWSYEFDPTERARRHTVFLKAIEPTPGQSIAMDNLNQKTRIGKTVDFVKLTSVKKVNPFDVDALPLSVLANVSQLFNQQPFVNLMMNGRKTIDEKSYATYFFQNSLAYYQQSNQSFRSAFAQLGYFHDRGSVQIGTGVQLNLPQVRNLGNNGPGLAAIYVVKPGHQVGISYSNNRGEFGKLKAANLNIGYSVRYRRILGGLGFAISNNSALYRSNLVSGGISTPLNRFQSIGIQASLENYTYKSQNSSGFLVAANYSINYFKQEASTRIQAQYHKLPAFLTGVDSIQNKPLFNAGLYNSFRVKKLITIQSQHNYFNNPIFSPLSSSYQRNTLLSNLVFFYSVKKRKTMLIPGFYMNYSEYFSQRLLSEGLQLNLTGAEQAANFRMGLTLRGGFNRLLSHPIYGTFFTAQINSFITCRTWNVNARYFYGPQSQFDVLSTLSRQARYSQILFLSVGNQYQFRNKHFILENTASYNYVYINMRQTTSLFTQVFYYAQNGWRFNFNFNVNYNVAESIRFVYDPAAKAKYEKENGSSLQKNFSLQFGIGVKKDFGIPLPKKLYKKKFTNAAFKVFMDVNGNRQFDKEESALENVIVRLNEFEAQTDLNGDLSFQNVALGRYRLQVFSLDNLGAWFPVYTDSIDLTGPTLNLIPFTRGVQIMGNVEMSREKFSAGMNGKLDISRIKIFVLDSTGHMLTTLTDQRGDFNFYLPYGSYTLRFDETILSTDFELAQNDIQVLLSGGMESFYHTFYIVERKRRIKSKRFDENGTVIEENKNTSEEPPAKLNKKN